MQISFLFKQTRALPDLFQPSLFPQSTQVGLTERQGTWLSTLPVGVAVVSFDMLKERWRPPWKKLYSYLKMKQLLQRLSYAYKQALMSNDAWKHKRIFTLLN